ncbi:rap guanine nucleotide exchange factor 6-like isoform X4 [Aotus nancymaae]|uniref:rap guanine nucleotide exchange factor 6-like isoform X4 n=1 Tax=Aotus nancymaae TaxID=37293 RepID=UPI0030FF18B2
MKNPPERTPQDLEIVYSYLHGMEALSNLREHQLRLMCETVRHERHEANEVLYYPDDIGTCWYIFLSGSVFIKESMFLPRSSFGKRSAGSFRRGCECIVLEPSEMIVVNYMDENEGVPRTAPTLHAPHDQGPMEEFPFGCAVLLFFQEDWPPSGWAGD